MIDVFEGLLTARLCGGGGTAMTDVFDGLLAARLFGDSSAVVWGEYDGTLPAAYTADGSYLADYRVYGASGGVGDETESGEPAGYKVPMSVSDGSTSATTPIYIGGTALGEDEYIDYGAGKIYRMISGVLTPTDPPVPLPQLPTCEGVTTTDYAGKATAETETNNIMPSAVAETKTVGNTTVTCDGHGRYHITKSGSGDNYVSFNVPEFTIPISVAGGGNGTVSFFNTMSDKAAVAFYYGSSRIDSWNMNSANRQTNSYGTMAGKVCNKIEINAWGSSTWTGDINIMFTNDGVLPTAFIPHIVETAKPRPGRFYAKYREV